MLAAYNVVVVGILFHAQTSRSSECLFRNERLDHLCQFSNWLPWDCSQCFGMTGGKAIRKRAICCDKTVSKDLCLTTCGYNQTADTELDKCYSRCHASRTEGTTKTHSHRYNTSYSPTKVSYVFPSKSQTNVFRSPSSLLAHKTASPHSTSRFTPLNPTMETTSFLDIFQTSSGLTSKEFTAIHKLATKPVYKTNAVHPQTTLNPSSYNYQSTNTAFQPTRHQSLILMSEKTTEVTIEQTTGTHNSSLPAIEKHTVKHQTDSRSFNQTAGNEIVTLSTETSTKTVTTHNKNLKQQSDVMFISSITTIAFTTQRALTATKLGGDIRTSMPLRKDTHIPSHSGVLSTMSTEFTTDKSTVSDTHLRHIETSTSLLDVTTVTYTGMSFTVKLQNIEQKWPLPNHSSSLTSEKDHHNFLNKVHVCNG